MSLVTAFNQWITLAAAHILLGTNSPADDASVQAMIDSIDAMILGYLQRDLRHAEYLEITFRPTGSYISLNNWPVISITTITSEGSAVAETEFDIDTNIGLMYYNAEGLTFTGIQPKDITVQYISGYTTLPPELVVMFNTLLVNRSEAGGSAAVADTGAIKKVSLVGVAAVEFDTGTSSVAYSGVDRLTGVPEELKPYVGLLDRYRSDRTMGVI
jgi:hypothetical protein